MRSRWGAIANTHAKVLTPSTPKSLPWGMTPAIEWTFCSIFFFCENTHTVWYENLWNWYGNRNLMIFDLLTSSKVTSLTLWWKFYLHSVLLVIPVDLICHMTMFEKNIFDPLGTPAPQSPTPWGMTQATEWKSCLICFVSFICEDTHKVWYKIIKIDFVIEIKWYLTFWPHPKVTSLTLGWKLYLHSVLLVTPVDLICHMTMFEKKKFLTPWAPPAPLSPIPRAWPRWQNKNSVWYVLYLSFVRTHTKFGIKIFKNDFVIEIKWYLTFDPPRAPGGEAK